MIINFLFVYLQKIIKMNLDNDKDFQKKLQKGYKRLALVSSIALSPKIVNRIWK